jgi:cytochrome c oxidase subunit 1
MAHDTHHHKESFITKYIFSQDHKMIGKQYLLTAIFMGAIGITLSALFRMKLGWPDERFPLLEAILGSDAAPDGLLDSNWYLGLVTLHGTIMVFFVLTGGLSGTFSNLLIPLQIGARDMASGLLNMIAYWLFFSFQLTDGSLTIY